MLKTIRSPIYLLVFCLLIASPGVSWAQYHRSDRHHGGHWDHDDHDRHRSRFSLNFSFWPSPYYFPSDYYGPTYYGPYYYRPYYYRTADVLVSSPPSPPPNYQVYVVNGVTYYLSNGNYYVYDGYNYILVSPPVGYTFQPSPPAPATLSVPRARPGATDVVITVNIPNGKGGSTVVNLRRQGNGFVGPQGESYAEFPTVEELQERYGT